MENPLLISQAARVLGVSAARVRQLTDSGSLECRRTANNIRLVPLAAVERLRREREARKRAK